MRTMATTTTFRPLGRLGKHVLRCVSASAGASVGRNKARRRDPLAIQCRKWRVVGYGTETRDPNRGADAKAAPRTITVPIQPDDAGEGGLRVALVNERVDVPEQERRLQRFNGSTAIPSPTASTTTTPAQTITRVKAKMLDEGFDIPDDGDGDGDGDGCVFLFPPYFL